MHRIRILKAANKLIRDNPYYGEMAMRSGLMESLYNIPNEPWVMALNDEELVGVIAHEAMHCITLGRSALRSLS